ncbi:hypothetical protein MRBLWH7_002517 [Microbacterium sp. LWH7-1.2]|uniref:hypothetical protein n=1 Tax=Microbacterium sp. LWH7-1.2 TaxID=3135257 RepID=UPI0031392B8E
MDGWLSAPDSDPESPELTEGPSRATDDERELSALRARAYGPEADISADPAAVARLIELEAAHLGAAASVPPAVATESTAEVRQAVSHGSRWRAWLLTGAMGIVAAAVAATIWFLFPHPDATLRETEPDADSAIIDVLSAQGRGPVASTLRQFETYHDVGVWSVENAAGRVCYVVWDVRGGGRFALTCGPQDRDVSLSLSVEPAGGDGFGEWLPEGSLVRFHFRGDTVDVFVRPPAD